MSTSSVTRAPPFRTTTISSSFADTPERNVLRAGLVERAEQWRWGLLWRWLRKPAPNPPLLSPWPMPRLPGWVARVNEPLSEKELAAVRRSARRGRPLGDEGGVESIARRLNLESTMRPRGRKRIRLPKEDIKEA
ncbi:MAG: hypothetical protein ACQESR_26615 [Planctomycetota bacterium]